MSVKQSNPLAFGGKNPIGSILQIDNTTGVALTIGVANTFQTMTLDVGTYEFYHTTIYTASVAPATGVFITCSNTFDAVNMHTLFNGTIPTANPFHGYRSGVFTVSTAGSFIFTTTATFGGGATVTRTAYHLKLVKIA
jgi:hypothetical protein